jgi:hypothetical protein
MAELPSGTVTFLFTYIEGSTAGWEQQPEAMRVALAHHDALIRAAIAEHGGQTCIIHEPRPVPLPGLRLSW